MTPLMPRATTEMAPPRSDCRPSSCETRLSPKKFMMGSADDSNVVRRARLAQRPVAGITVVAVEIEDAVGLRRAVVADVRRIPVDVSPRPEAALDVRTDRRPPVRSPPVG